MGYTSAWSSKHRIWSSAGPIKSACRTCFVSTSNARKRLRSCEYRICTIPLTAIMASSRRRWADVYDNFWARITPLYISKCSWFRLRYSWAKTRPSTFTRPELREELLTIWKEIIAILEPLDDTIKRHQSDVYFLAKNQKITNASLIIFETIIWLSYAAHGEEDIPHCNCYNNFYYGCSNGNCRK